MNSQVLHLYTFFFFLLTCKQFSFFLLAVVYLLDQIMDEIISLKVQLLFLSQDASCLMKKKRERFTLICNQEDI